MPDGMSNVDNTILKLAEQYQSCNVRSRAINEERAQIRDNVDKLGIDPKAFQHGLALVRDKTAGERGDYTSSLNRVVGILDGKAADLFGADDMAARDKRAAKRAEKKAKAAGSGEPADNPRGDPKKGGAGGVDGHAKAKDAAPKKGRRSVADRVAANAAAAGEQVPVSNDELPDPPSTIHNTVKAGDAAIAESLAGINADKEQEEGGAVLDDMVNRVNGGDKPSQSQVAAKKRAAAGLN